MNLLRFIRPELVRKGRCPLSDWGDIFIGNVRFDSPIGNAGVHHLVKEKLTSILEPIHILGHSRIAAAEVCVTSLNLLLSESSVKKIGHKVM